MPPAVRSSFGHGLFLAQRGERAPNAKPLKGFGGRDVVELIEDGIGGTWRAVYTVRYPEAMFVLHAFQKEAKSAIATPKHTMDLIVFDFETPRCCA